MRSYCRQAQLARLYPWLNGSPVDAICLGNPDLYLLAKKDDNSLAIGLWNYSKDKILAHPQNLWVDLGSGRSPS